MIVYAPRDPKGADRDPRGTRGAPRAPFRHPYWTLAGFPMFSFVFSKVESTGFPLFCIVFLRGLRGFPLFLFESAGFAWSFNPMETSPLDLRSVTVLPRALLEVSPDPPVRRRRQHNKTTTQQPSEHQQPPVNIAPRVVR